MGEEILDRDDNAATLGEFFMHLTEGTGMQQLFIAIDEVRLCIGNGVTPPAYEGDRGLASLYAGIGSSVTEGDLPAIRERIAANIEFYLSTLGG